MLLVLKPTILYSNLANCSKEMERPRSLPDAAYLHRPQRVSEVSESGFLIAQLLASALHLLEFLALAPEYFID